MASVPCVKTGQTASGAQGGVRDRGQLGLDLCVLRSCAGCLLPAQLPGSTAVKDLGSMSRDVLNLGAVPNWD